jgi:hypothetical protein
VEAVGNDFSGEQVVGRINFYPGSGAVMVAVGGELIGVGFWHYLGGGVLDEDAADLAVLQCVCDRHETLQGQFEKEIHGESSRSRADTLVHGLAGHRINAPVPIQEARLHLLI